MLTLRPYQKKAVSDTYQLIRSQRRKILLVAPTGSGKTIMSSRVVKDAVSRQRRLLFVVHRKILIDQTYNKFQKFGLECGFIKSGYPENRDALVQIASVGTLEEREWWKDYPADVILLDEAHITAFAKIVAEMMRRIYPRAIYLGLTATPWRLAKNEGMGDMFTDLVCAPMPYQLIEAGFLVKPSYYSLKQPDLDKVKINDGDFDSQQLAVACNTPEQIEATVKDWFRLAYGRRTIAFTEDVKHAQNLAAAFEKYGIPSAYVSGKTSTEIRHKIYKQLENGEILLLASCAALSEGFDVPAVNAVFLCRPTKSKALYFQQVGRGLRISPDTGKQDCIVLDKAGNVLRHGFVEDLKEVSLSPGEVSLTPGKEKSEREEAPIKVCPQDDDGCGAILYSSQMVCPQCGYEFQRKRLRNFLKLARVMNDEDWERLEIYRSKLRQAHQKSYDPAWAAAVFIKNFGFFPPWDWGKGAVFGEQPTDEHRRSYQSHLMEIASRKNKDKDWIEKYFGLEFGS